VNINDPCESAVFSMDEIEMLAELEHKRWHAERSLAGWTFGEADDKKIRTTPFLVDWKDLDESIKDYDRGAVRNIPVILGLIEMKVVRRHGNKLNPGN
jgi:hypothetical protein